MLIYVKENRREAYIPRYYVSGAWQRVFAKHANTSRLRTRWCVSQSRHYLLDEWFSLPSSFSLWQIISCASSLSIQRRAAEKFTKARYRLVKQRKEMLYEEQSEMEGEKRVATKTVYMEVWVREKQSGRKRERLRKMWLALTKGVG